MKRKIVIDRSKCGQIGRNVLSASNQNNVDSPKVRLRREIRKCYY